MKKALIITFIIVINILNAQEGKNTLKIYLDCEYCDEDYFKQEINYVEFVRDRNYADVHIQFTSQSNASNGVHYTLDFIGQQKYTKINDILDFSTSGQTTNGQERKLILKNLELGLVRYWIANGLKDKITISIKKEKNNDSKKEEIDPWNKWTFRIAARGYFNGQESNKSRNINGNFRVNQVTEKNKFSLRLGLSNNQSVFTYNNEDIISERKSSYIYASDVVSVNDHWSAGLFASANQSLFSNNAFSFSLKPGVEYNFFDYKESQKKAIVVSYTAGLVHKKYYDLTVFGKEKELLWQHNLSLEGVVVKKWGNVSGGISYRSYLHDSALNGFNANLNTSLRLFKGLSLDIWGSYGLSHDQINIRAEGTTLEDLLLAQKQIKSGYNYYGSIGLSYTFGSIYNSIVNPRFDF